MDGLICLNAILFDRHALEPFDISAVGVLSLQVLLSCSHVFHRVSFKMYAKWSVVNNMTNAQWCCKHKIHRSQHCDQYGHKCDQVLVTKMSVAVDNC